MAHYRILKQVEKNKDGIIVTVAMIDSQGETVEFSDTEFYEATKFVSIMNANTTQGLLYLIEKVI